MLACCYKMFHFSFGICLLLAASACIFPKRPPPHPKKGSLLGSDLLSDRWLGHFFFFFKPRRGRAQTKQEEHTSLFTFGGFLCATYWRNFNGGCRMMQRRQEWARNLAFSWYQNARTRWSTTVRFYMSVNILNCAKIVHCMKINRHKCDKIKNWITQWELNCNISIRYNIFMAVT